ncbi:MAG: hypothetical protein HY650_13100 [Acidobacteria bacterium]|nr:hypothetical protein [Acidobacteriota bacterium]
MSTVIVAVIAGACAVRAAPGVPALGPALKVIEPGRSSPVFSADTTVN